MKPVLTRELKYLGWCLPRPALWVSLLLGLLLATLAYQRPFSAALNLAAPDAAPYISNFYPPQQVEGRDARWSHAYSYVRIPGTGGNRPLRITLEIDPARPGVAAPQPISFSAFVGGEELYSGKLRPGSGWQSITLDAGPAHPIAMSARDLVIEMRTDVYRPPDYQGNELGVLMSRIDIEPLPSAPWAPVVPNVRVMLLVGVLVAGLYLLTGRLLWALSRRGTWLLWMVPIAAGITVATALFFDLVESAAAVSTLAALAIGGYLLVVLGLWLVPWLSPALLGEARVLGAALAYRPLLMLLAFPVLFAFAWQAPLSYSIDVGSGRDEAFLQGFSSPLFPMPDGSPGNYRTSTSHALIIVPGATPGDEFNVTLRLRPGTSSELRNSPVRIAWNGKEVARVNLRPGWQDVKARVGPIEGVGATSLDLDVFSPVAFAGGEQQGVLVDTVSVEQASGSAPLSLSLPYEAALTLGALLLYLLVARASGLSSLLGVRRAALAVSVTAGAAIAWAVAAYKAEVALALPHILITLVAGYVLLILASRLLRNAPPLLPAALSIAFMLRFGFSALPQLTVIDLPYHLRWLGTLLSGDFAALYLPGDLSSVPPEWNLNVLIPKSPLFYVAMWPLGLLRGLDLGPAVLFLVSLMDALMVLVIYALVRQVRRDAAIWAALLYAAMPLAFRAFSYGILPTIFAQALTLPALLVPAVWPERLRRPLWLVGWVLLLAASLVAFPTTLVFNSMVLVLVGLGWAWRKAAPARTSWLVLLGLGLALGLSVGSYYGLYIGPLVTRTIPALAQGTGSSGGSALWPGGPPELLGWTLDYLINGLPWVLMFIAPALIWRDRSAQARRLSVLMLAWLAVLVIGMALNLRFDMIGKHLYYTMPAAAIAGGLVFAGLWRREHAAHRTLVVLVAISIVWLALVFTAGRI